MNRVQVFMMITTHCSRQCSFCYVGRNSDSVHKPLEQISGELARGRQLSDGNSLVLSGGEPTLHPQILEIMELANRYGFTQIEFFSNGRRLGNRNFVDRLVRAGLHSVMISLHGSCPEVHKGLVGKDDFFQVLKGIGTVLEAGVKVTVNTVVTTVNLTDIGSIYQLIKNKFPNILNYRITYPALTGNILKNPGLAPGYEDVTSLIFSLLADSSSIPLSCELIPLCLLGANVNIAVELYRPRAINFMLNGVKSRYNRIGGRPCLRCRFKTSCRGLQFEAVRQYGVPNSYGKYS